MFLSHIKFFHFLVWLNPFRYPLPSYICTIFDTLPSLYQNSPLCCNQRKIQSSDMCQFQYCIFFALVLSKITWEGLNWIFHSISLAIFFHFHLLNNNYDSNITLDGDERLITRQQIHHINDYIVERLNNSLIVDVYINII